MGSIALARSGEYALATGPNAFGRLHLLHRIYSPAGREALLEAGLTEGMKVADFGCGVGMTTRMLASLVGPSGNVTGVDLHSEQLEQAMEWCQLDGHENTAFVTADACDTGLPRNHFDMVYCRFLLLHLTDPEACLQEMWQVLKPGGVLVVEDGDLAAAGSVPPTALDAFANLFRRLAPIRGVDYSLSNRLSQMVVDAGFSEIKLKVHQPADRDGNMGLLMKWTAEEAGPAFIESGLVPQDDFQWLLADMERAANNPDVLAIGPRMSLVTGRKLVN